jgi:rRNA maturation RNase YbeY
LRQRLNVIVTNHQRTRKVELRLLRRVVRSLLADLAVGDCELSVHLIGTEDATRLNESFLRHGGSTDVITFDYSDHANHQTPPPLPLHGEILICVAEAVGQGRRFHTMWQAEVVRYAVHGILHLLGYDDSHLAARRVMKRAEDRCLRRLASRFHLTKLARRRVYA